MSDNIRRLGAVGLAVIALGGPCLASARTTPSLPGIVPQGFWMLNPSRSHSLNPGRQKLWVIKDDGQELVWVAVTTDNRHHVQIASYHGAYGGPPAPVVGTPMTTRLVARGASSLHNSGTITGMGDYSEDCTVFPNRKRFRCEGNVATRDGDKRYVDDFDWYGASPHSARSSSRSLPRGPAVAAANVSHACVARADRERH